MIFWQPYASEVLYLRSDTQCMLDRCDTAAPGLHCMPLLWFKLSISTGPTEDSTSTMGITTAFRSCYRLWWQGHTMVTEEVLPPTTWLHSSKAPLEGHQWTTRGRWNYSCQFILIRSEVLTYHVFAVSLSQQYFHVWSSKIRPQLELMLYETPLLLEPCMQQPF